MEKQHITLSVEDSNYLDNLLSKGSIKVRVQKRALALKKLDSGMSYQSVSDLVEISYPTILNWAKKYRADGLKFLNFSRLVHPILTLETFVSQRMYDIGEV